ncbi:hypothetical protein JW926_06935 [Candidatus Sumerlaeota bacterium]|nr:hypothetical protein [Candidatus Sumerlaeota bacterium]
MIKQKEALDMLEDIRKLHELWISFDQFLLKSFTTDPISQEMEQQFLDIKSKTSKYLRVLAQKIDSKQFKYEPDKMTNLLRQAISIIHLRGLPMADRKNLIILWHEAYIHLTQVMGAFEFISEGYQPKKKESRDTSIAALKKGAADAQKRNKKEGMGKTIIMIALFILIVGVVFFMIKR